MTKNTGATRIHRLQRRKPTIQRAMRNLENLLDSKPTPIREIRIREEFVLRPTPAPTGSDRKAPDHDHLPPATRLISPRGSNLQLMLIAMFEAHTSTRAGAAPTNNRDLTGSGHTIIGWTDLLALDAHPRPSKPGEPKKIYASPADMKHRQLSRTLEDLLILMWVNSDGAERDTLLPW